MWLSGTMEPLVALLAEPADDVPLVILMVALGFVGSALFTGRAFERSAPNLLSEARASFHFFSVLAVGCVPKPRSFSVALLLPPRPHVFAPRSTAPTLPTTCDFVAKLRPGMRLAMKRTPPYAPLDLLAKRIRQSRFHMKRVYRNGAKISKKGPTK